MSKCEGVIVEVWDGGGGSVVGHYTTGRVHSTCVRQCQQTEHSKKQTNCQRHVSITDQATNG